MNWVYGRDWAQAASTQARELEEVGHAATQLLRQHDARRQEVAGQSKHALEELVATLLPTLGRDHLRAAAELTGYTPLLTNNPIEAMNAEANDLTDKLSKIESDTRFIHREHLRDPRGGKLVLELAELDAARRALEPFFSATAHPRLHHLLAVGYGTGDYKVPFWRLSYYSDWEAADAILARVPGKTFEQFRAEYEENDRAMRALNERASEIHTELRRGAELDHQHATLKQALATIPERMLARVRESLGRHVMDSGAVALGARFAAAPAVDILAKRAFGLAAKLTYLDALRERELAPVLAEVQQGRARAMRDAMKFSRPKKLGMAIPAENYQRRFRPVRERYQKRFHRYRESSDAVYVFDRYDRGSLAADFLWWDVMTDGRLDGDFIPEVARFHHSNPNYAYQRSAYADDAESAHYAQGFHASAFTDAS